MICKVVVSKLASRQLEKVPKNIQEKLTAWVMLVREKGLDFVRRVPGYHDELLKGNRVGQRSIRLNRAYRAIYFIVYEEKENSIVIKEVCKHDY